MNNLLQEAKGSKERAYRFYKEAKVVEERVKQLPVELTEHDWGDGVSVSVATYGSRVILNLSLIGGDRSQAVADIKDYLGRTLGFSFEKVFHLWSDNFGYTGTMTIPDADWSAEIRLQYAPQPVGCKLIKKTEWREVDTFEAICEDTGDRV